MKKIVLEKNQWWIMTIICLFIIALELFLFHKLGIWDYFESLFSLFSCPGIFLCKVPIIKGLSNPLGILSYMGLFFAICYLIFTKIFDISKLD